VHNSTNLRYKAVGHWKAKNSSNKRGAAKKEEIPVEAAWLLKRKMTGLGSDAADILRVLLVNSASLSMYNVRQVRT
jgi:hypothetical protein